MPICPLFYFIKQVDNKYVDILYAGLKRLPQLGEELYSDGFKLCLGGGVPGTMAVSYTHLDVYKRQPLRAFQGREEDLCPYIRRALLRNTSSP